jgi:hypothetical protein
MYKERLKPRFQSDQKDHRCEAREKPILRPRSGQARRRRTHAVRWSETVEHNDADGSFSTVWKRQPEGQHLFAFFTPCATEITRFSGPWICLAP